MVSFVHSSWEASCIDQIKKYCDQVETVKFNSLRAYRNCLLYFPFSEPFQVTYWYSREMQRLVDKIIDKNEFDVIHAQFFRMAQYITKYTDHCKVLDSCDSYSLNLSRRARLDRGVSWPLLKVEASRVKLYETEIARWFDRVTMVSELDRDYLLSINSSVPVSIVPMGVDLEYFQPNRNISEPNLLFTGIMRYFPNIDAVTYFYNEIFPLVKKAVPNAKFYIVGNSPAKKVTKLMSNDDVVVTGRVEDVRPYFDKSAVFVCPLRSGSGMQTKIIESMAMKIPVVTTSFGFEALEATAGKDIIVADSKEKFAQEVIRLLKDKELRQNIAQNARKLVEEKYGWASVVRRLDTVYEDITATRQRNMHD